MVEEERTRHVLEHIGLERVRLDLAREAGLQHAIGAACEERHAEPGRVGEQSLLLVDPARDLGDQSGREALRLGRLDDGIPLRRGRRCCWRAARVLREGRGPTGDRQDRDGQRRRGRAPPRGSASV